MVTRVYLPSSGAAPISPAYDSAWEDTSAAARLAAVTARISSSMTTFEFLDADLSNRDVLAYQYILGPLAAQTIGAQTVLWQIRCQEGNSSNNMFTALGIRAVASDATTFRGTLLAVTLDATEIATTGLVNRAFSATTSSVTVQDGDYLVLEIGAGGDPTGANTGSFGSGHDYRLRIGDASASDLPEDDTDTNDYNPWIEFANTITFGGGGGSFTPRLALLGVG